MHEIPQASVLVKDRIIKTNSKKLKKLSRPDILTIFINTARELEIYTQNEIMNSGYKNLRPEIHVFYGGLVYLKQRADRINLPITNKFITQYLDSVGPWIEDLLS